MKHYYSIKALVNGEILIITPALIKERVGMKTESAKRRYERLLNKEITVEQALAPKPPMYSGGLKKYERNGLTLDIDDVRSRVEGISAKAAGHRLRAWEAGRLDFEKLYRPVGEPLVKPKTVGEISWNKFKDKDRRKPETIKVSEFELRLGEEIERAWRRDVKHSR